MTGTLNVKYKERSLTDGSKVFSVQVIENDGLDQATAEFACRDEKTALELFGILDKMVREHKIVGLDAEYISVPKSL